MTTTRRRRCGALAASALVLAGMPAARAGGTPTCFGAKATIVGTHDRDELHGTPGRDVIEGLGLRDKIFGGGGDHHTVSARGG